MSTEITKLVWLLTNEENTCKDRFEIQICKDMPTKSLSISWTRIEVIQVQHFTTEIMHLQTSTKKWYPKRAILKSFWETLSQKIPTPETPISSMIRRIEASVELLKTVSKELIRWRIIDLRWIILHFCPMAHLKFRGEEKTPWELYQTNKGAFLKTSKWNGMRRLVFHSWTNKCAKLKSLKRLLGTKYRLLKKLTP